MTDETTTSLSFGPCARCGAEVTGSSVHVSRRHDHDDFVVIGPEMDVYHPACAPYAQVVFGGASS